MRPFLYALCLWLLGYVQSFGKDIVEVQFEATQTSPSTIVATVHFDIAPDWHIYGPALDDGEAGLPTQLQFDSPLGQPEIRWPNTRTYAGKFAVEAHFKIPATLQTTSTTLKLHASWLACGEQCVPGKITREQNLHLNTHPSKTINGVSLKMLMLWAWLGGLILNAMPCVFPVLSIKAMSLVKAAKEDSRAVQLHALLFVVGVVLSFMVLAGALLLFRATGQQLGWGFQLQNPACVLFLVVLFFILTGMFAGVWHFEPSIHLSGAALSASGLMGSFASGLLTTLIATPCTAPFMGIAIGAALTMPTLQALTLFLCMALGLATPYALIALFPKMLQTLPRPGMWMVYAQRALALPLALTVLWLLHVFYRQTSLSAVVYVACTLLAIAWLLHAYRKISKYLVLVGALTIFVGLTLSLKIPRATTTSSIRETDWIPYSESNLQVALKEHKIVFLEFTAAWCLTCRANELVLQTDAVQQLFKTYDVAKIRADWTTFNADITQLLKTFGRSGVPVSVIYKEGQAHVLPALLTIDNIKSMIAPIKTQR